VANKTMLVCVLGSLLSVLPSGALASSGDESWAFRSCVTTCRQTGCAADAAILAAQKENNVTGAAEEKTAGATRTVGYCSPLCEDKNNDAEKFWLTISSWDCSSDCRYRCMWLLEDKKQATEGGTTKIEKYFGKWPFVRALGAQEPASVLFSILNLVANMVCSGKVLGVVRQNRRNINSSRSGPTTRPTTRSKATSCVSTTTSTTTTNSSTPDLKVYPVLWLIHFILSANAWLWSSIFHCRDTRSTERFDYFSAGALVAFNLFSSLSRVGGVVKTNTFTGIGIPIVVMYSIHVWRMLNVLFDYGLHVGLCVAAGAIQTAVWLAWALTSKSGRAHPGRGYLLAFMGALNVSMLLEVLDFPPLWKIFDAHALWHAATAPLTMLWYRFVAADVALVLGLKSSNARSMYKTKS
jgi:post-GPI attachment to proteins factor 3